MNLKSPNTPRALITGACIVLALALIAAYALLDPSKSLFPRCLFFMLTGLECPGCGSQRAVHSLLHGDLQAAFGFNPLMVMLIPYVVACAWLEFLGGKERFPRVRRALMGMEACYALLALIGVFFIVRNLLT